MIFAIICQMEMSDRFQIRYEKEKLQFVTGYMQKEFSLDKKGQEAWDDNCLQFIKKHEIISTQL